VVIGDFFDAHGPSPHAIARGYTLIELVTVISIVAILGSDRRVPRFFDHSLFARAAMPTNSRAPSGFSQKVAIATGCQACSSTATGAAIRPWQGCERQSLQCRVQHVEQPVTNADGQQMGRKRAERGHDQRVSLTFGPDGLLSERRWRECRGRFAHLVISTVSGYAEVQ